VKATRTALPTGISTSRIGKLLYWCNAKGSRPSYVGTSQLYGRGSFRDDVAGMILEVEGDDMPKGLNLMLLSCVLDSLCFNVENERPPWKVLNASFGWWKW